MLSSFSRGVVACLLLFAWLFIFFPLRLVAFAPPPCLLSVLVCVTRHSATLTRQSRSLIVTHCLVLAGLQDDLLWCVLLYFFLLAQEIFRSSYQRKSLTPRFRVS